MELLAVFKNELASPFAFGPGLPCNMGDLAHKSAQSLFVTASSCPISWLWPTALLRQRQSWHDLRRTSSGASFSRPRQYWLWTAFWGGQVHVLPQRVNRNQAERPIRSPMLRSSLSNWRRDSIVRHSVIGGHSWAEDGLKRVGGSIDISGSAAAAMGTRAVPKPRARVIASGRATHSLTRSFPHGGKEFV